MKGAGKSPKARVIRMVSRMESLKADLAKAGIEFENERGRADFHAPRHKFNLRMAENGVPLAFAQRAMRHSDSRLTSNQYLDPALASLSKSLEGLRGSPRQMIYHPKMPPASGSGGHFVSSSGTKAGQQEAPQPVETKWTCHPLTLPVTRGQKAPPVGIKSTTLQSSENFRR
jgi:hypothetical protein